MKHNHPVILAYEARKANNSPVIPQAAPVPAKLLPVHIMPAPSPVLIQPSTIPIEVVDIDNPMWIENPALIEELRDSFASAVYDPRNGYIVNEYNGHVSSFDGSGAGVISALAINYDTDNGKVNTASAYIANTENAGLRYVHHAEDGTMFDIGPVINTCFIGNFERPEGIYIPLANSKAMADGLDMIQHMMNKRIETGKGMKSDPRIGCGENCSSCSHMEPDEDF